MTLRFSSVSYSRLENSQEKANIPHAFVFSPLDPFCESQLLSSEPQSCSHCGCYSTAQTVNCQFCGNPTTATPIYTDSEWIIDNEDPTTTFFIIDASHFSQSTNFLKDILDILINEASPLYQKCVFLFTAGKTFSIYLTNRSIISFIEPQGMLLPPNAVHTGIPSSITSVSSLSFSREDSDLITAIKFIGSVANTGDRIISFIASAPPSFSKIQPGSDIGVLSGLNFGAELAAIDDRLASKDIIFDVVYQSVSSRNIDLATFAKLATNRGGRVLYINNHRNFSTVLHDFLQAPPIKAKLKMSNGIKIGSSHGLQSFNPDAIHMITPHSLSFPFKLPEYMTGPIYLQSVITYMGPDGKYRKQVSTVSAFPTDNPVEVFENSSQFVLAKIASDRYARIYADPQNTRNFRGYGLALLKPTIFSYRVYASMSPERYKSLVLPSNFDSLPRMMLGIMKCTAYNPGIMLDQRAAQMHLLNRMSPNDLPNIGCRWMAEITSYLAGTGEQKRLSLTERNLKTDSIILMNTGFDTWLYLGKKADRDVCEKAFGTGNPVLLKEVKHINTPESERFWGMVHGELRFFVEENESAIRLFMDQLIEDTSSHHDSYAHWMAALNKCTLPQDWKEPRKTDQQPNFLERLAEKLAPQTRM